MIAHLKYNFVEHGGVLQVVVRKLAVELGPELQIKAIVKPALLISRKALRSIGKAV
jgi:hypothetical protein